MEGLKQHSPEVTSMSLTQWLSGMQQSFTIELEMSGLRLGVPSVEITNWLQSAISATSSSEQQSQVDESQTPRMNRAARRAAERQQR
jgi:hypothetical protein